MPKKVKWAILGCGGIARAFAKDLAFVPQAKIVAAGSRDINKAKAFADEFNADYAFGSYNQLVKCDDVDIVYIATPHPMHFEDTMMALENGKAVLCEKPFTLNASQASGLIQYARDKKLFLMEAMWTRFIPATIKIKQLMSDNAIGQVKVFSADFGVNFKFDPLHRAFNPNLGGGALLDLGVYPISFASMVFACQPKKIASVVDIGSTGVDFNSSISFSYSDGAVASIHCGLTANTPRHANICGTKGRIIIDSPFFCSKRFTLELDSSESKVFDIPFDGHGLRFEAQHCCQLLSEGAIESPIMPLDETLAIIQTMDEIRKQWNLKYPQ